jgi:polysaccharide export outer membrane protein
MKRVVILSVICLATIALTGGLLAWGQTSQSQEQQNRYSQPKPASNNSSSTATAPSNKPAGPPADAAAALKEGTASSSPSFTDSEPLIGVGDLVHISVMGAPEFDQDLRVGANGDASVALVGAVHLAGLTPDAAAQTLRKRLMDGGFFSDPQVTVLEKEYATQGVSVLGEVQKPGVYPIVGPRNLFDVLSLAGGTTAKAGQVVSITHRKLPTKLETVTLSNDPSKNLDANVQVLPGDTVVVSKAGIVYVVGDVHHPTGVIMDNGGTLTVLQAVAMAEGVNNTAALNKSKVIRKTSEGQKEIPIELKKIMSAKTPDVNLVAGDIVFIPSSAAKSAAARSLDAAVRLATGVVAYRAVY